MNENAPVCPLSKGQCSAVCAWFLPYLSQDMLGRCAVGAIAEILQEQQAQNRKNERIASVIAEKRR